MSSLEGKNILLGISGSIAAYKTAFLTRLLVKAGASVQIVMTPASTKFITPLTLSTLSKHPVYTDVTSEDSWNNHVELGLWADAMVIAPATATTMAKLAHGLADNMVTAVYLSARCPVFLAPAMDLDMWAHPSTQENLESLQRHGVNLLPVEHGELASGLVGKGRMAEPEFIVAHLASFFEENQVLKGKKALVTAGPTYEAIDPVRFIGNRSSGKMGIAIAEHLAAKGAEVTLVLGPSAHKAKGKNVQTIRVESAQEMYEAAITAFPECDIAVMAAAVADYRPKEVADQKIKKKTADLAIELEKTKDIAAHLGAIKKDDQLLVGFALETEQETANAKGKLARKNFDFIVLNSLRDPGAGFGHDTNKITIFHSDNKTQQFELKTKDAVAADIVEVIRQYVEA